MRLPSGRRALLASTLALCLIAASPAAQQSLPSGPLVIRAFTLRFDPAGTFTLSGDGWPSMAGTWTTSGREVTLQSQTGPDDCTGAGRYTFSVDGARVNFNLVADACTPRRMILDRSQWSPPGVQPATEARRIVRRPGSVKSALRPRGAGTGYWPSFRGHEAAGSAEKQNLPDQWSPASGTNVLWRRPIPGLAHSSPIVWGDAVFVTSAISSRPDATFKPGLYGDGDASED